MPRKISLREWDARYVDLLADGLTEPAYGGKLSRHVLAEGDLRLTHLQFDNSPAALRLWNFLLTENQRLRRARRHGDRIIGTMKDLGTIPVLAYSLPGVRAFYPDGAWWTPCLMECSDGLLQQAEGLGIDASFCPVRAMLPAFQTEEHFPRPDLLICSTGAVCDDFSAIAQRLERMGFPVVWWEMPRRRIPSPGEPFCELPDGTRAPAIQAVIVASELERIAETLAEIVGRRLDEPLLRRGIARANQVRQLLARLRARVFGAPAAPLPALEMLIAEMLAIHFCSDLDETVAVLSGLLAETDARLANATFVTSEQAVRVFWINPVADLRAMNLLEDWGGRLCGSDFMFTHSLLPIPEDVPPFEALARVALADPMVGSAADRARHIVAACRETRAEAAVVSRIPGASHCAWEGSVILNHIQRELAIPAVEVEVPPISDPLQMTLSSRLQALIETARARRPTT